MRLKKDIIKDIVDYCEPHLNLTWAAMMISMIFDCAFRDCHLEVKKYRIKEKKGPKQIWKQKLKKI